MQVGTTGVVGALCSLYTKAHVLGKAANKVISPSVQRLLTREVEKLALSSLEELKLLRLPGGSCAHEDEFHIRKSIENMSGGSGVFNG